MKSVALIGIGGMGHVHFNAYKSLKNAKVIAVADVRVDMAKEKVNDETIPVYHDIDELFAHVKPDIVDICTPSYLHSELAVKALEHDCHVLCEKPMSITSENTGIMIETAKKHGKLLMIAQVVRFMAPFIYLKSIIDSKELGNPVHIDMQRISSIPRWSHEDWMRDTKRSGGVGIDLSVHDLDFVQYTFGEPKEVKGVYRDLTDNNNYLVSNLIYDGFDVTVTGTWYNCDIPFEAKYLAVFENGYVALKDRKIFKNGQEVALEQNVTQADTGINISNTDGYAEEIAYFVSCVENGKQPMMSLPESSERSIKLVENILKNSINITK